MREALAQVGKKGRVVHIAHSQGALITYLASKRLSLLEMQQIEVIAFGGAAVLQSNVKTPFARCVNYYSVNDPLLLLVPQAVQALESGFVNDEFCFLAPRVGDPVRDHSLLAPTYAQALQWEGIRFQKSYQRLVFRTMRKLVLLLVALWHTIVARIASASLILAKPLRAAMRVGQKWHSALEEKIRPLVVFMFLLARWVQESLARILGTDKYTPVSTEMLATA